MIESKSRQKKLCPVCNSSVIHLPRHLQNVHHWKAEKARCAVQVYGLRKSSSSVANEHKPKSDCHRYKQCPMDKCSHSVKRLSSHLLEFHHLNKKSALFRSMLVLARKRSSVLNDVDSNSSTDSQSLVSDTLGFGSNDLGVLFSDNDDSDEDDKDKDKDVCTRMDCNDPQDKCELPTDFLQFQSWLQTPDGGRKCEKSAKQHAFQVGVIFHANDGHVSSLWSKKSLNKFLTTDVIEKQFEAGTIKSYLNSLRHWYDYILSEEADRLDSDEKQQIQQSSNRVAKWIASYRKDSASRALEKMDEDISKLITSDKVAQYDKSESALSAIKYLGEVSDGLLHDVSMMEYVQVRDFLLLQIILSNANRSGVLANLTLEQFNGAQFVDGSYVLSVSQHKTAFMYGPAKIVLTPMLYSWMSLFVKYVRSQITKRATGNAMYLFLSWTGEPFESGGITRAIQSAWKKAGLGTEISCTTMRKSAVSSIHQMYPQEKSNLADLMCHTVQTAGKSYRLVQRQQTSVAASKLLTQVMKTRPVSLPIGIEGVPQESHSLESDSQDHHMSIESTDDHVYKMIDNDQTDSVELNSESLKTGQTESDDESIIVGPSIKSSKSLFGTSDTKVLVDACQEIIKSGPISQKRITDAMEKSTETLSIFHKFTIAQIISRVKYERRKLRSNIPLFVVKM